MRAERYEAGTSRPWDDRELIWNRGTPLWYSTRDGIPSRVYLAGGRMRQIDYESFMRFFPAARPPMEVRR